MAWHYLWITLFLLTVLGSWCLTVLGLPGNWVMVAAAAIFTWLHAPEGGSVISWTVVIALGLMAGLGELIELAAGALGVKKLGGSTRGAVMAIGGSFAGAVIGGFLGLPIPVVGSIVGVILFSALGAFGGAALGEYWHGKKIGQTLQIAHAAFWGRLFGTLAKIGIASVMVLISLAAVVF